MPSEGPAAVASRDYGTSAGQFEKPGDSPPIPPGTDGGELGIEPGIGQLGIPRPVWTLQINLAAAHDEGIRRRAVRGQRRHAEGIRLVRQKQDVEPLLGRSGMQKRIIAEGLADLLHADRKIVVYGMIV